MTAIEPSGEPWPYSWPENEHCYSHGVHEPIPADGAYLVCFECGHVFVTALDLLLDYAVNSPPDIPVPGDITAKDINFCPHCIHDF